MVMELGVLGAVVVALNVTGAWPLMPAVTSWMPTVGPRVQCALATPAALEAVVMGLTLPPPPLTLQVTLAPDTAFPYWSVTFATSDSGSADPLTPLCPSPPTLVTVVGASGTPTALNTPNTSARPVWV